MAMLEHRMQEIVQRYERGEHSARIARDFCVSGQTIRVWLEKVGVKRRTISERNHKYTYRHDSFEHFEPVTAYWAGLLAADGSVSDDGLVSLELHKKDRELVDGLASFMEYSGPVLPRTRIQKSGFLSEMVSLRVTAPDIATQLLLWGVVPRKTCMAKGIELKPDLECHFYRGLFDGDGCFHISKNGKLYANIAKHPAIIDGFRDWCWRTFREVGSLAKKKNYHVVQFGGESACLLGQALYSSNGPRLTRKNDLVDEWIQRKEFAPVCKS